MDYLIERIWDELGLVKIYTKKRGVRPDLSDPVCLRKGATIEVRPFIYPSDLTLKHRLYFCGVQTVCNGIHRSLADNFRYGLVWVRVLLVLGTDST